MIETLLRRALICAGLLSSLASALPQQSLAAGAKPDPAEDLKHGAVLCAWFIYREAKEIGTKCTRDEDAKLQSALDHAVDRIDDYMIANVPLTRARLEEWKRGRGLMDPADRLCHGGGLQLYALLKKQGAEAIEKSVSLLLAVPRRPEMTPCL